MTNFDLFFDPSQFLKKSSKCRVTKGIKNVQQKYGQIVTHMHIYDKVLDMSHKKSNM
jgi:hypothetical protein